jgi:Tat protein translocase TatB subunit
MFGIGIPELVVILVVLLVFVGPERLPEVAKFLGKIFTEFRKATDDVSEELRSARLMLEEEIRQAEREAREEKSPPDATLPPGGRPGETGASVPRTKADTELSSAPKKKESSAGEPS